MKLSSLVIFIACLLIAACDVQNVVQVKAASEIKNYEDARKLFWKSVYAGQVKSLYCGESFNSNERRGFNVEHVFPMSWAVNGLNCGTRKQCRTRSDEFNLIEADMHNLYPSRSDVNQRRSSYRFGIIKGEARKFGKQCDFEVDDRARTAEPKPSVRGNVARAMFYMADRYKQQGLVIFKNQATMLYKWHKADLPDEAERQRNDRIERLQGNRNPFIDEPERLEVLINNGHFF